MRGVHRPAIMLLPGFPFEHAAQLDPDHFDLREGIDPFGDVNLLSAKASILSAMSICFPRKHRSFRRCQFAFGESIDPFGDVNLLSVKVSILSALSICIRLTTLSFRF